MENVGTARIQEERLQGKLVLSVLACALFLCFAAYTSIPANAQVLFGSMVGTVTDASGAAVPDATVQITEMQTNGTRTVKSSGSGAYTVSTIPPGTYRISITKQGFSNSVTPSVQVLANQVARVDATLQVGSISQTVEVQAAANAQLQTDSADVHAELSAQVFENAPQSTRTYQGVFNLVPGMLPPTGQLSGGTNNPSKSMNFGANGTGTTGPNVRIEGLSATAPRQQYQTSYVPSTEAIQSVNVVTNSPDAEQGLSGGPSVTVLLKSGSNGVHGAFYWLNVTSATEANNWFQPAGSKPPHLVDNTAGGWIGGPVIPNKLFYWAGYEGSYVLQGYAGIISVPTPQMLSGDLSGSSSPVFDPSTGNQSTGAGRAAFAGNIIPANRISPVAKILNSHAPAPNLPGVTNNLSTVQSTSYNLHKIDTKIDYQATSKLRVTGRYGYQPYNNVQQPLFGTFLGGASSSWPAFSANGAGNYQQYGATLAISGSATYVFSPTLVADFTFGVTQAHQLLFPVQTNVKVGSDTLGIPGTNIGTLPFAGGMPQFDIANYPSSTGTGVTWGYSYTPLEYKDPVFEYTGNVTKIIGSHNIRAGEDIINTHMNHIEVNPTVFQFTGAVTSSPGGASPGIYQGVADYLLGLPATTNNSALGVPQVQWRYWNISFYARDQWQMNHKMTVNYGLRYEYYPVPSVVNPGMPFNNLVADPNNPTVSLCGVNGNSSSCGISVSKKLFAPSIGIAYRATDKIVVRSGYALSPMQVQMANTALYSYPLTTQQVFNGASSFLPAPTTLATGFPVIATPNFAAGTLAIPSGTGNLATAPKNFIRGYFQTYNLTVQDDLGHGLIFQIGYVGTHGVNLSNAVNFNYGQVGGGSASQPFAKYGVTAAVTSFQPASSDLYNALQVTLQKRLSNGLSFQSAYTWSRAIQKGYTFNGTNETGAQAIAIPQLWNLNKQVDANDRTHNFIISTSYALPFGPDRQYLTHGPAAWVLGGWSVNGTFYHYSGLPFSVTSAAASCNCPGSTQRANQVKPSVSKVGRGVGGQGYFDPAAFAPVTTAAFGNASYNSLRGPGATNLDANVFRDFHIWKRVVMQFRAESLNVTNTPHFGNPVANVSSATLVGGAGTVSGGFDQITSLNPLGRLIDPRYFRFGVRFTF